MRTSHFPDWRGGAKNGQFRLGVAAGIVGGDRLSIVLAARDTSAIERSITRSVLGLPLLGQPPHRGAWHSLATSANGGYLSGA
jgi:hypothetical protein